MAEFCQECSRLLADYVKEVRQVRIALEAAALAAEAGVIDDTGLSLLTGKSRGGSRRFDTRNSILPTPPGAARDGSEQ